MEKKPDTITEEAIKKVDKEEVEAQNVMLKNEFDFDTILGIEEGMGVDEEKETAREEIEKEKKVIEKPKAMRRNVICTIRKDRNIYRRAFSETQLLDVLGFNFQDGESYHCISGGDVDALSYLKCVLRQQDLEHCLFSTWCMAMDDILQIQEWLEAGKIKTCDAYVGEIFRGSYSAEYDMLKPIIKEHKGRFVIYRNHAKIIAGRGKKFDFALESSANINTNLRSENSCLTIGEGIYKFYKEYYDSIISFEKEERENNK